MKKQKKISWTRWSYQQLFQLFSLQLRARQVELFWFCDVYHTQTHLFIKCCPAVIAAVCLFRATLCTRAGKHFDLSITTSVKRLTLEDWIRQRHSTSDRWGSESERTGRRMLGGKGVVQDSWRPRYWTRFLLCKVNRIWMDRSCISLQVLINRWLLNNVWHGCLRVFDSDMKMDSGYWRD